MPVLMMTRRDPHPLVDGDLSTCSVASTEGGSNADGGPVWMRVDLSRSRPIDTVTLVLPAPQVALYFRGSLSVFVGDGASEYSGNARCEATRSIDSLVTGISTDGDLATEFSDLGDAHTRKANQFVEFSCGGSGGPGGGRGGARAGESGSFGGALHGRYIFIVNNTRSWDSGSSKFQRMLKLCDVLAKGEDSESVASLRQDKAVAYWNFGRFGHANFGAGGGAGQGGAESGGGGASKDPSAVGPVTSADTSREAIALKSGGWRFGLGSLTLRGGAFAGPGVVGTSGLHLNGLDGLATTATASKIMGLSGSKNALTAECWVRPSRPQSADATRADLLSRNNWAMSISGGKLCWNLPGGMSFCSEDLTSVDSAGDASSSASASLTQDKWVHMAVSVDGTTVNLYANGRRRGQRTLPAPIDFSTESYTLLGAGLSSGGSSRSFYLQGALDEVALFAIALPQSRIRHHVASAAMARLAQWQFQKDTNIRAVDGSALSSLVLAAHPSRPASIAHTLGSGSVVVDLEKRVTASSVEIRTPLLLCQAQRLLMNDQGTPQGEYCGDHTGSIRDFTVEYSAVTSDIATDEPWLHEEPWLPIPDASSTVGEMDVVVTVNFNAVSSRYFRINILSSWNGVPGIGNIRFKGHETKLHDDMRVLTMKKPCCSFSLTLESSIVAKVNGDTFKGPSNVPYGRWFHLAVTKRHSPPADPEGAAIYIDGELVQRAATGNDLKSALGGDTNAWTTVNIGGKESSAAQPFAGAIDDIRFWTKSLSETEVRQVMYPASSSAMSGGNTQLFPAPVAPALNFDSGNWRGHLSGLHGPDVVGTPDDSRRGLAFTRSLRGHGKRTVLKQFSTTAPTPPGSVLAMSVVATAVGDELLVTWDVPVDRGGIDILGYELYATELGNNAAEELVYQCTEGSNCNVVDGKSHRRNTVITNLKAEVVYSFRVLSINAAGKSKHSGSVAQKTASATKPESPRNLRLLQVPHVYEDPSTHPLNKQGEPILRATDTEACDNFGIGRPPCLPSAGNLSVAWDAPKRDGGSPVKEYWITLSPLVEDDGTGMGDFPGALANEMTWVRDPNTRYVIISGRLVLTAGTSYTWNVRAVNVADVKSELASLAQQTKAAAKPGPPLDFRIVELTGGAVALAWTPPADTGGSAITDYQIYSTKEKFGCERFEGGDQVCLPGGDMPSQCDVDGSGMCNDRTVFLFKGRIPCTFGPGGERLKSNGEPGSTRRMRNGRPSELTVPSKKACAAWCDTLPADSYGCEYSAGTCYEPDAGTGKTFDSAGIISGDLQRWACFTLPPSSESRRQACTDSVGGRTEPGECRGGWANGLSVDTSYELRVGAVNAFGRGHLSDPVRIPQGSRTDPSQPYFEDGVRDGTGGLLTDARTAITSASVFLQWQEPFDTGGGQLLYYTLEQKEEKPEKKPYTEIYRGKDPQFLAKGANIVSDAEYLFKVRAHVVPPGAATSVAVSQLRSDPVLLRGHSCNPVADPNDPLTPCLSSPEDVTSKINTPSGKDNGLLEFANSAVAVVEKASDGVIGVTVTRTGGLDNPIRVLITNTKRTFSLIFRCIRCSNGDATHPIFRGHGAMEGSGGPYANSTASAPPQRVAGVEMQVNILDGVNSADSTSGPQGLLKPTELASVDNDPAKIFTGVNTFTGSSFTVTRKDRLPDGDGRMSLSIRASDCDASNPCMECQGACEVDSDCAGDLRCFDNSDAPLSLAPPGCTGTVADSYCWKVPGVTQSHAAGDYGEWTIDTWVKVSKENLDSNQREWHTLSSSYIIQNGQTKGDRHVTIRAGNHVPDANNYPVGSKISDVFYPAKTHNGNDLQVLDLKDNDAGGDGWVRLTVVARAISGDQTSGVSAEASQRCSGNAVKDCWTLSTFFYIDGTLRGKIDRRAARAEIYAIGGNDEEDDERWGYLSDFHFYAGTALSESEIRTMQNDEWTPDREVLFVAGVDTAVIPVTYAQSDICETRTPARSVKLQLVELDKSSQYENTDVLDSSGDDLFNMEVNVVDDGDAGVLSLTETNVMKTESENGGTLILTVTRTGGTSGRIRTPWSLNLGTAKDTHIDLSGQASFFELEDGVDKATLKVQFTQDTLYDWNLQTLQDRTFSVYIGPKLLAHWEFDEALSTAHWFDPAVQTGDGTEYFGDQKFNEFDPRAQVSREPNAVFDSSPARSKIERDGNLGDGGEKTELFPRRSANYLSLYGQPPRYDVVSPLHRFREPGERLGHGAVEFASEWLQQIFNSRETKSTGFSRFERIKESASDTSNVDDFAFRADKSYLVETLVRVCPRPFKAYSAVDLNDWQNGTHIISNGCQSDPAFWSLTLDETGIPVVAMRFRDESTGDLYPAQGQAPFEIRGNRSLFAKSCASKTDENDADQPSGWHHLAFLFRGGAGGSTKNLAFLVDRKEIGRINNMNLPGSAAMELASDVAHLRTFTIGSGPVRASASPTGTDCKQRAFSGKINFARVSTDVGSFNDVALTELLYPRSTCMGQLGDASAVKACVQRKAVCLNDQDSDLRTCVEDKLQQCSGLLSTAADVTIMDDGDRGGPYKPIDPVEVVSKTTGGSMTIRLTLPRHKGSADATFAWIQIQMKPNEIGQNSFSDVFSGPLGKDAKHHYHGQTSELPIEWQYNKVEGDLISGNEATYTRNGLIADKQYCWRYRIRNDYPEKAGDWSGYSNNGCFNTASPTPPSTPLKPTLYDGNTGGKIAVQWRLPRDCGGVQILGFRVLAAQLNGMPQIVWEETSGELSRWCHHKLFEQKQDQHADFTMLSLAQLPGDELIKANTEYEVYVEVSNSAGDSLRSPALSVTTSDASAPEKPILHCDKDPTDVEKCILPLERMTGGTLIVSWDPPKNTGGKEIEGYMMEYRKHGDTNWDVPFAFPDKETWSQKCDAKADLYSQCNLGSYWPPDEKNSRTDTVLRSGGSRLFKLHRLAAAMDYDLRLRAKNSEGLSEWSDSKTFTTPSASLPVRVPEDDISVVSNTGGSFTVEWVPPSDTGGTDPAQLEYELSVNVLGQAFTFESITLASKSGRYSQHVEEFNADAVRFRVAMGPVEAPMLSEYLLRDTTYTYKLVVLNSASMCYRLEDNVNDPRARKPLGHFAVSGLYDSDGISHERKGCCHEMRTSDC